MQSLQRFMVTDLSNFHLDITKDRLYVRAADSDDRRACQTVLAALLQVSSCISAFQPMTPAYSSTLNRHKQYAPTLCILDSADT